MKYLCQTPKGASLFIRRRWGFYHDVRLAATYLAIGPFFWIRSH